MSQQDWEKVGQDRALQFTLLDKIIEKCDINQGGFKDIIKDAVWEVNIKPKPRIMGP